ncbi:Exodeoxyribonuclease 7 small subunit [Weissella viridescens]|uniref:Exodeoxyribonuclease VII small subunit n=1 Tax=Weissella viridescens TaxID=1629 RepID=A0A380NYJ4_WEIVI|nr:Exodeoxyribonuclease 7 small subunit [Weissella viridescens]
MEQSLERAEQRTAKAVAGLQLVSPLSILARGYGLVEKDDKIMRSVNDLHVDDMVAIRLADGTVNAQIKQLEKQMTDKPTFEENLTKLEQIVTQLEKGDVPLEEALAQFETGIQLSQTLKKHFSQQNKV